MANFVMPNYRLKISTLPIYPEVVKLHQARPGALFLDVGCGCGSDTRKIVSDGWPHHHVLASDLHAGKHTIPYLALLNLKSRYQ